MSCGVGQRCGLDPALLWLWCRPAAAAPIWPLAWELPYDTGATIKKKRKNIYWTLINITYSAKYITKISYDYTLLNKIISNNESNVNYIIRISNINKNNFSDQFEYFDNLIKKKN